jgi:hypothetical protein
VIYIVWLLDFQQKLFSLMMWPAGSSIGGGKWNIQKKPPAYR